MRINRDKYTREDGRPTFAFWREVSKAMKQIHENVEATKLIQKQMDEEKPRQERAWEEFRQAMAKYGFI